VKVSHIRSDRGDQATIKAKLRDLLSVESGYGSAMYKSVGPFMNLAKSKLGELRGKMVVVLDFSEYVNATEGLFRYADGFNDGVCASMSDANLTVCDMYANTDSFCEMRRDQLTKWEGNAVLGSGRLFLLSWTLTSTPVLSKTIEDLAEDANRRLPGVLREQYKRVGSGRMPNIVYVDFLNSETAQEIVKYNFE
ncbi:MAG: hypothetical protein KDD47_25055, partial [Acidobacteria bacterium]|nr:hypothetical protein [Acidobacteriota bacterium]